MSDPLVRGAGYSRIAGVALVLVQCATIALLEYGYLFAIVNSLLAMLSLWDRVRIEPHQAPHWLWFALLGLIVLIKHQFLPQQFPDRITFLETELAFEIARFLIFLQTVRLYVRYPHGQFPPWMAAIAVLGMVMASDVRLGVSNRTSSMVLCLLFVTGFGWFSLARRRWLNSKGAAVAAFGTVFTLVAASAAGWGTATALRHYEEQIEQFLEHAGLNSSDDSSLGFRGDGRIGGVSSFKQVDAEQIALRVLSDQKPGYLKGAVFDQFHEIEWTTNFDQDLIQPTLKSMQAFHTGEDVFSLDRNYTLSPEPVTTHSMSFRPVLGSEARLFLPAYPLTITINEISLVRTMGDVYSRATKWGGPYSVTHSTRPLAQPITATEMELDLHISDTLRPFLEQQAEEIFAGCQTTRDKLDAVVQFFHRNYQYELHAHVPRRENAVEYFLRERPNGHCELFASAGALLLRTVDVPTRYVTGYIATDHNELGGFWLARRRDAHAWIEAFDTDTQQWITVECTPSDGIPTEQAVSEWHRWMEAQRHRYEEWLLSMTRGGLAGMVLKLGRFLFSVPILVLILTLASGTLFWRKHRLANTDRPAKDLGDPALRRLLRRADRRARKLGFQRSPDETLSAFASRLRASAETGEIPDSAIADWYDTYVRVRYGHVDTAFAAATLVAQWNHIFSGRTLRN